MSEQTPAPATRSDQNTGAYVLVQVGAVNDGSDMMDLVIHSEGIALADIPAVLSAAAQAVLDGEPSAEPEESGSEPTQSTPDA